MFTCYCLWSVLVGQKRSRSCLTSPTYFLLFMKGLITGLFVNQSYNEHYHRLLWLKAYELEYLLRVPLGHNTEIFGIIVLLYALILILNQATTTVIKQFCLWTFLKPFMSSYHLFHKDSYVIPFLTSISLISCFILYLWFHDFLGIKSYKYVLQVRVSSSALQLPTLFKNIFL